MIDVRRRERLGALFREEIAAVISHRMADPRVGLVSVTSVAVSADLSAAKVFVFIHGDAEDIQQGLAALNHAASFVRAEVAKRVRLKQVPLLRFVVDDSIHHGAVVDRLLQQWHEEPSVSIE